MAFGVSADVSAARALRQPRAARVCRAPRRRHARPSAPAGCAMVSEVQRAPEVVSASNAAELAAETHPPFRARVGIVLMNIGTPASTSVSDVREYLRQFLGDPRVVDINPVLKYFLLNFVVLPFRPRKSAEAYASIWDPERGSPLLFHSEDLAEKLRNHLGEKYSIMLGMQFGEPSVYTALKTFRQTGVDRIVVVPMFPQYASSTTGSAVEIVYREAAKLYSTPYLHVCPAFFDHPRYISSYASIIGRVIGPRAANVDHLLMSFHGVPGSHCTGTDETGAYCQKVPNCCAQLVQANRNCYRAQCFASARRIAAALDLPAEKYSVAFQSRLDAAGPKWIEPYTDMRIKQLAKDGVKKLAVVVPSFTADCLETLEEIGEEGKEFFLENGGEEYTLIPCLNSDDEWAEALIEIVKDSCPLDTWDL
ncbi:Ferrochelatase [Porphyridium purpureum]|uniref:Ferrochelatase n=1 Tax=Porphyridium purpureum TaxID=35688 RepID=A0A5J4YVQ5_PORPP|nr:Ferrochelatase [Porphyridium purpureum]|eukprot:POR4039..scf209_3